MPKKRRQAKIPTPAWEPPRGAIGSRVLGRGFQFYGLVVVLLLVAAALGWVIYGFGADELEKRGRPGSTAVQVEDTSYRLDYFSRRLKMFVDQNGGPGVVRPEIALPLVSDLLIREDIVRRFAGEREVTATDEETREAIASGEGSWSGLGIAADDGSFDLVLQQQLARLEISEPDLRQMIEAAILERKLRDKFVAEVQASAESVRYRQILVSEQERADELVAEIGKGGDFAALAAENSLDVETKDNGGEVGWLPRGVLDASTEELVFALEPDELSVIPIGQSWFLIEMLEKDDAHPVEEERKGPLADRAFGDWVEEKMQPLSIVNNMDPGGNFDSGKAQWAVDRAYQS